MIARIDICPSAAHVIFESTSTRSWDGCTYSRGNPRSYFAGRRTGVSCRVLIFVILPLERRGPICWLRISRPKELRYVRLRDPSAVVHFHVAYIHVNVMSHRPEELCGECLHRNGTSLYIHRRCIGNCVLLAKVINEFVSRTRQLNVTECLLGSVTSCCTQLSSTVLRATWVMNSTVTRWWCTNTCAQGRVWIISKHDSH